MDWPGWPGAVRFDPVGRMESYGLSGPELADLELLLSGAVAPLDRFLSPAEARAATGTGRLPDGTPAPVAPVLWVPAAVATAAREAGGLELTDPEGLPLARLTTDPPPPGPDARTGPDGWEWLAGRVEGLAVPTHGAFRALRRSPAQVRAAYPDGATALVVDRPLRATEVAALPGGALLLVRVGDAVDGVPAEVLLRATLAAAPTGATVVAVDVLRHVGVRPQRLCPRR